MEIIRAEKAIRVLVFLSAIKVSTTKQNREGIFLCSYGTHYYTMSATQNLPRSVIVTGGASGIGLAMVRHFASLPNHAIAILDVNEKAGRRVSEDLGQEFPETRLSFKKCNIASWDEQAAVFEDVYREHGNRVDVVMANAGINEGGPVTVVDLDEEKPSRPELKTLDINLVGTIYSE